MLFGMFGSSHKKGCRCVQCLSVYDQRESAARQLFQLLDLAWAGIRSAVTYAEMIRRGDDDLLSKPAQENLAYMRHHNPTLLDQLLSDILD